MLPNNMQTHNIWSGINIMGGIYIYYVLYMYNEIYTNIFCSHTLSNVTWTSKLNENE